MARAGKRILIYSHDSFGLGHLRRCRAIAHSLVQSDEGMSVLILSGSPIIGSFEFRDRVDYLRVPGIIKLKNGEYTSLSADLNVEETLALRAAIIRDTADAFDPDLFLVDKEPLGLRGEIQAALHLLKRRGASLVLGLRDVMDEPDVLAVEWRRKKAMPALSDHYDEVWIYGLPQICEPLSGLKVPPSVARKLVYTGYLRRMVTAPPADTRISAAPFGKDGYLLVTAGGGGDGGDMIDWVLRAYESSVGVPHPAFIVFGPFLDAKRQAAFRRRVARLENVAATTFDSQPESWISNARAVVAMGGYNTFCEILSFDKRALIVPRTQPRLEQFIRADRAEELGLAKMLADDGERDPEVMAVALRQLPQQSLPSRVVLPGLLDGLENVNKLAARLLAPGRRAPRVVRAHS